MFCCWPIWVRSAALLAVDRSQHDGVADEDDDRGDGGEQQAALAQGQRVDARHQGKEALFHLRGSSGTDCRLNSTQGAAAGLPSGPLTAAGWLIDRLAKDFPCISGSPVKRDR